MDGGTYHAVRGVRTRKFCSNRRPGGIGRNGRSPGDPAGQGGNAPQGVSSSVASGANVQGVDARGRRLRAALAAVLVRADAPELRLVHD